MGVFSIREKARSLRGSRALRFDYLIGFLICAACVGCVGDRLPDTLKLEVSQSGNQVAFDLPLGRTARSYLREIQVVSISTANSSLTETKFWEVEAGTQNIPVRWPLKYGEKIAGAREFAPAKPLIPGRYRVRGEVHLEYPDGAIVTGQQGVLDSTFVFAEFSIPSR